MKNSDEQNYKYSINVKQKVIVDFCKTYNVDIKKFNYNHIVMISFINDLIITSKIPSFRTNLETDFVYMSKSFVKQQLPFLNLSTNTETRLFDTLEETGIIKKYIDELAGNKRYIKFTDEFRKIWNNNLNINPIEQLKKDKKYWNTIENEYGKNKHFEYWLINFELKYYEKEKEMTNYDLKKFFKDYLTRCYVNSTSLKIK